MFTIFHVAKSAEMQTCQKDMLLHYVDLYADTENGKFLKSIDYHNLTYKWCYNMPLTTVVGCWSMLTPNTIFLAPPEENKACTNDPNYPLYLDSRNNCTSINTRIISFIPV